MGFAAVWCQFAQTTFYYPAVLAYVASTLAYVIDPSLAHSGVYTMGVIVIVFWAAVLASTRGVVAVDKLASYGILLGTLVPGLLLVVLATTYLLQGNPSAAPLDAHHALPAWHGLASIVLVVNGFFTYAGVEVNAVHVDELRDAPREFPRAIFLAVILILLVFIFPTLAISVVIPSTHISLTAGVMQAFRTLLRHFGLGVLEPVIALGLVLAAVSGLLDWLTGPSTGLLDIGRERGYLPPFFQKVNSSGVQVRILVTQGIVITLIGVLYAVAPSVSRGLLDPRRPRNRGLPDHVRPHVYRGPQPPTPSAPASARLPSTRARAGLHRRDARVGDGLRDRAPAAEPARPRERAGVRPRHDRRNPSHRRAPTCPALPDAEARLEDRLNRHRSRRAASRL